MTLLFLPDDPRNVGFTYSLEKGEVSAEPISQSSCEIYDLVTPSWLDFTLGSACIILVYRSI